MAVCHRGATNGSVRIDESSHTNAYGLSAEGCGDIVRDVDATARRSPSQVAGATNRLADLLGRPRCRCDGNGGRSRFLKGGSFALPALPQRRIVFDGPGVAGLREFAVPFFGDFVGNSARRTVQYRPLSHGPITTYGARGWRLRRWRWLRFDRWGWRQRQVRKRDFLFLMALDDADRGECSSNPRPQKKKDDSGYGERSDTSAATLFVSR